MAITYLRLGVVEDPGLGLVELRPGAGEVERLPGAGEVERLPGAGVLVLRPEGVVVGSLTSLATLI